MNTDLSRQQPQCIIEESEPHKVDGKLMKSIVSTHSDGFVCLRFVDVEEDSVSPEPVSIESDCVLKSDT